MVHGSLVAIRENMVEVTIKVGGYGGVERVKIAVIGGCEAPCRRYGPSANHWDGGMEELGCTGA